MNAAIDWVIHGAVKLVKSAGNVIKGMFGKKEKAQAAPTGSDPQHDAKVEAGLAAIDREDHARLKDGRLSKEDAEQVAVKVKHEHPVFKSLGVVEGSDTWDYDYTASPGNRYVGAHKGSGILKVASIKVDARDADDVQHASTEGGIAYEEAVMATAVAGRGERRLGPVGESLQRFAGVKIRMTTRGLHRPSSQAEARLNVGRGMRVTSGDTKIEVVPEARMEVLVPKGRGAIAGVALVEVTLVEDFHEGSKGSNVFAVHKVDQFMTTIDSLVTRYGPNIPIRYYFMCPRKPTDATKDYIVGVIKERHLTNFRVIWLQVKTGK